MEINKTVRELIEEKQYNADLNKVVNDEIAALPLKVRREFLDWCNDYGYITDDNYKIYEDNFETELEELK